TLPAGASGDAMTQVGFSRAVLTRLAVSFSMARRSNTTRTGGRRGVTGPRTVSCGSSRRAVVPPTAIASNPARSQCTYSRAAAPPLARGRERHDLRVRPSEFRVKPLAGHGPTLQDDGADEGIRSDAPPTPQREVEGASHRLPFGRSVRSRSGARRLRRHGPPWGRSWRSSLGGA